MQFPKYLGSKAVLDLKGTPYENFTKEDWVLEYIAAYGQIDGSHHKQWVLDQVARILLGTPVIVELAKWDDGTSEYRFRLSKKPSSHYSKWANEQKDNGEYEIGIAP